MMTIERGGMHLRRWKLGRRGSGCRKTCLLQQDFYVQGSPMLNRLLPIPLSSPTPGGSAMLVQMNVHEGACFTLPGKQHMRVLAVSRDLLPTTAYFQFLIGQRT